MNKQKGGIEIYIIGLLLIFATIFVGNLLPFDKSLANPTTASIQDIPLVSGNNLQLKEPGITVVSTPTPTPSTPALSPTPPITTTPILPRCPIDDGVSHTNCDCPNNTKLVCNNGQCVSYQGDPSRCPLAYSGCRDVGTGFTCYDKPVIYLYPTKEMLVNVKLTIPGTVTVSIPTYPETGWQNVLAHPDGRLEYQGKAYSELYYETAVTKTVKPTTGIVISKQNLQTSLISLTTHLGLLPSEQKEFMEYWLPRLTKLNSPYIFVSVLTKEEKDLVDHVDISPKPDVFIEMLFYFKPLTFPIGPTTLTLPQKPPQRNGFTAVEWGGTIDNN